MENPTGLRNDRRRHRKGLGGPITVEWFSAGQYVLRKKSAGTLLKSAHAIDRTEQVAFARTSDARAAAARDAGRSIPLR